MRTFTAYIEYDTESKSYFGIFPRIVGAHTAGDSLDEHSYQSKRGARIMP